MNTPHQQPASRSRAAEALEPRRLLSAVVENGVLVVTGTPFNDTIFVWKDNATYRVLQPGDDVSIPTAGVHSVTLRGLGGDDFLNAQTSGQGPGEVPLDLPARLEGGNGNDRLYGSLRRSVIYGGFGNDTISGGEGSDWIDGGWGNDVISGGGWGNDPVSENDGNDIIFGRYGNDVLWGIAGDDRLYGGPGDDQLGYYAKVGGPEDHEPGNDLLVGGPGNDRLIGGAGTDRLIGGPGLDQFFYLDTREEMIDWTPGEPTDYQPPPW